jgi:hypothetical protein
MDRIAEAESLETIVRREVEDYSHSHAHQAVLHFLEDPAKKLYSFVIIPYQNHPALKAPKISILAQVTEDKVIIYQDTTDKPLVDELLRCGVPRSQIILRYAGETVPELSDEEEG